MKLIFLSLCLLTITPIISAAPNASWNLDELGTSTYSYNIDDSLGNNDGTAYMAPSTGNASGKICSAIDLSSDSTNDFIFLGENALDGASDFTISVWHKGSSINGRSLLSGARVGQHNELLMWLSNGDRFNGYINGNATAAINFPSITDDQWHHLVWRRSGAESCFFTDGIQRGCNVIQEKVLEIDSLVLGQEQDSIGGDFDLAQDWEGLVDELLVFTNALSNADIQSIYTNQNAGNAWDGSVRTCQTTTPQPPTVNYDYSDWHFDASGWNGSANEVIDSHGGQHGIAHSIPSVTGKICNAMDFSASSTQDYVQLGASALDGVSDFTVSVWHKGTSIKGQALLSGATNGSDNEFLFWFTNPTKFNGHLKGGSLGSVISSSFTDGNWHHLVWTRTGALSCYYLDAQLQGCQSNTTSAPLNIASLIIGQDQDNVGGAFSSSQDWEGILDELLIFKRSFDSNAISSIYNYQNNGKNWDGSHRSCPDMPAMQLSKTSRVISDPINQTSNPKRIPGAIVRYTITAENAHATAAENVVIGDNLSSEISAGTLSWVGNIKVISANINGGISTNLSDASDADAGEFINNILSINCGAINNTAPCIAEYDIEITQ
ncbi:MAG TPA: hypothetical protein EYG68_07675 [Leucothrix mucor]|nr:hypothetical protein [Leucothrix mucor]